VIVRGSCTAPTANPAPVTANAETTRSAVPVLVTTTVLELLVPTVTFPNESVVGLVETAGEPVVVPPPPDAPAVPQPANNRSIAAAAAIRQMVFAA
jgi:hypothetical protein